MQTDARQKALEETTKTILEKMDFPAKIFINSKISPTQDDEKSPLNIDIQTEESKFLIGKGGANLAALQHLLRLMVRKELGEQVDFDVDVNNYKENHHKNISILAQDMAVKATNEQKQVVLEPMNSFERRLVHMELAEFEGVKTESIGEDEDRKVVIKPVSIEDELGL